MVISLKLAIFTYKRCHTFSILRKYSGGTKKYPLEVVESTASSWLYVDMLRSQFPFNSWEGCVAPVRSMLGIGSGHLCRGERVEVGMNLEWATWVSLI